MASRLPRSWVATPTGARHRALAFPERRAAARGRRPDAVSATSRPPSGPAVILCDANVPLAYHDLAVYLRSQGLDVVVVSQAPGCATTRPDGTRVLYSGEHDTRLRQLVIHTLLRKAVLAVERVFQWPQRYAGRVAKRFDDPWLWYPYVTESLLNASAVAATALALRPSFVFGQEVASYGLATALCRGVPKVLFPWGHDIFVCVDTSWLLFALTRFALNSADLVVPASVSATRYIADRFDVPPERIQGISWGVDRHAFRRASAEQRRAICARWGVDPAALVVLNVRRFRPAWGCFVALRAFVQVACETAGVHFIMLGGAGSERYVAQARAILAEEGLAARFTLLEGDAPLSVCAELMSVSDVFVSLLKTGDMRSSSVLQAAAAGGAPIVADGPEYRHMEAAGFAGVFVEPESVADVVNALRWYIAHPEKRADVTARNAVYIATHEDPERQMARLLDAIRTAARDYPVSF